MPLGKSIEQWPSRSTIRCAAVVDHDGELVERLVAGDLDWEATAALAVSLLRMARQLGTTASAGPTGTVVVGGSRGTTIVADLPGDLVLVLVAHPDRDIGQLLFDVRRHRTHLVGAS